MRQNRMRDLLAAGKIPFGTMIDEFPGRGMAKVVEGAGADFAFLDMEHGGMDFGTVADMLAWFKATTVTPIVRVPSSDYHFIARVMDAGAMGVMVPNVRTPEQAQDVVDAMRFAPEGHRGLGLGMAHNDYLPPDPDARGYMDEANRSNIAVCQIESTTALQNLEAIAGLPGVDVLWVGHSDLSQSMGIVGEFHHPDFLDALHRVVDAAQRHGKAAGIQPGTIEQAREWMAIGFNAISFSVDFKIYSSALESALSELRK